RAPAAEHEDHQDDDRQVTPFGEVQVQGTRHVQGLSVRARQGEEAQEAKAALLELPLAQDLHGPRARPLHLPRARVQRGRARPDPGEEELQYLNNRDTPSEARPVRLAKRQTRGARGAERRYWPGWYAVPRDLH